jgi:hypothetical protein
MAAPTPRLSADASAALAGASTATLTAQLLLRGFRNTFIRGLVPTRPDLRMVGYAYTLRYVPTREDVTVKGIRPDNETNLQRRAVDSVGRDEVPLERVRGGEPIGDLYPLAESRRAEYEEWKRRREGER